MGQSAVVVADIGSPEGVLLVPQKAIIQTLDKSSVWVLGKDKMVTSKAVRLGEKFGGHWIVEEGLSAGEMVVINGLQNLRNGEKVIAEVVQK